MNKKQINADEGIISANLSDQIIKEANLRRELVCKSHIWFFNVYFSDYVKYETAPFQKEMFSITEDQKNVMAVIVAFRGSAKSTIMTLSYPIWAILGEQQKKFVLILSQTQQQARLHLSNIRRELEGNELLRHDLGPFQEEADEWGSVSLVIPQYNARISIASSEQSIRGMRHGAHRPDLIIADDVEDINSVKTKEGRDKTYRWCTSEIIPMGSIGTKIIFIGNLLHRDSLLMRFKSEINEGIRSAIFKEYPLVNNKGAILWTGMYPDQSAIENLRKKVVDKFSWNREYLLKIIDDVEAVVLPHDIHYYKELPNDDNKELEYSHHAIGIDPAFSLKDHADFTAMVSVKVYGWGKARNFYILPNPINEKLTINQMTKYVERLVNSYGDKYNTQIIVEDVGGQTSIIQIFTNDRYRVDGFKPAGMDKRSRLSIVAGLIQTGRILFPEHGAEKLIDQILGFGVESHDDQVDALTGMILKLIENDKTYIPLPPDPYKDDPRCKPFTAGLRYMKF